MKLDTNLGQYVLMQLSTDSAQYFPRATTRNLILFPGLLRCSRFRRGGRCRLCGGDGGRHGRGGLRTGSIEAKHGAAPSTKALASNLRLDLGLVYPSTLCFLLISGVHET